MKKIRWGVLSTAKIGTEKVIPAMQLGKYCKITAIASRKLEKAQAAAKRLGIEKAYGSYEELLIDPDIDAVYIPLPNHLHVPWAIKALKTVLAKFTKNAAGISIAANSVGVLMLGIVIVASAMEIGVKPGPLVALEANRPKE